MFSYAVFTFVATVTPTLLELTQSATVQIQTTAVPTALISI